MSYIFLLSLHQTHCSKENKGPQNILTRKFRGPDNASINDNSGVYFYSSSMTKIQ